jgi:hypothetical protein
MEAVSCSETSVNFYRGIPPHIPVLLVVNFMTDCKGDYRIMYRKGCRRKRLCCNFRSANIAAGYRLDGRGSIPDSGKRFFSSPQRVDRL